jgi:uncharacterized RDD family membrane protein YckC
MGTLKIDTSQNIDIEQPIASIGERIAATLLDMLFIMSYTLIIALIAGGFNYSWVIFFASLPVALYSITSELLMNGQSWGKKILKIRVVKMDGTPATFSSYFLRWILRLIEILVMFGSLATITIILNRKGQRIGDIAANTAVIRLRNKSLKETVYTQIPDNYIVVYPEVSSLSINDIYTIKEVLEALRSRQTTMQLITIAQKAHEAIELKLNIKGNQDTVAFFQTILRDYNFINSRF